MRAFCFTKKKWNCFVCRAHIALRYLSRVKTCETQNGSLLRVFKMIILSRYSHFQLSFTLLNNLTRNLDKNVCNNQVLLVSGFFPYRTMICKSTQTLDPNHPIASDLRAWWLRLSERPNDIIPLVQKSQSLVCRKPIFNPSSAFRLVKLYNRRNMSSDVQIPSSQHEIIPGKGKSMAEIDATQRRKEAAIDIQKT